MSGKYGAKELANMEVLSARLLHDVAGSVGSVISYVECVLEDPESEEVRSCLEEALEGMVSRFRLIRQAYSSSEDNSSFENTRCHIEQYLKKRGMSLTSWHVDAQFADIEFVEKVNRLTVQAVLFSAMMMVKAKGIAVTVSQSNNAANIELTLDAEELAVHKDIEGILPHSDGSSELTTHNVQAYFMLLLCREYNAEFQYDINKRVVSVTLPL